MGALMNWKLQKSLTGASGELARFANHKEIASIIRPETRASLSPPAAAFLQAALAGSLRIAFIFVLAAVLISTIIALFIPGGGAHELAHHEHKPVDLTEEAAAAVPEL